MTLDRHCSRNADSYLDNPDGPWTTHARLSNGDELPGDVGHVVGRGGQTTTIEAGEGNDAKIESPVEAREHRTRHYGDDLVAREDDVAVREGGISAGRRWRHAVG